MRRFVRDRLTGYAAGRNHPELDGTSQLSPYLHFGHIGPRTVAVTVRDADAPEVDREAFLEEMVVRRELAVNYVRFNPRYDRLDGCDPNGYAGIAWAIGGKHDRAWGSERPVYGKVRYMSLASTGRKFDSRMSIARWLGNVEQ